LTEENEKIDIISLLKAVKNLKVIGLMRHKNYIEVGFPSRIERENFVETWI